MTWNKETEVSLASIDGLTLKDCIEFFRLRKTGTMVLGKREIADKIKAYLYAKPQGFVVDTAQMLTEIWPDSLHRQDISRIALQIAKKSPRLATHDGETFEAYGRTNRRWRWHGQATARTEDQEEW